MNRSRILIASVLKPVDDTRMLEKMASTLAQHGKYEVWVAGFPSTRSIPDTSGIHFFSLPIFSRLSIARLLAPVRILRLSFKVKPHIIIVNTHELLIVGLLNRIFFGTRLVYDIRENYFRNILYSEVFPAPLRPVLAGWVRLKEKLCAPFVHLFLLAEKGYQREMHFFGNRDVVIENKATARLTGRGRLKGDTITLLFSGTIAESTGVFNAIRLAEKLHSQDSHIRLKIIGYAGAAHARQEVRRAMAGKDYIDAIGLDQLVPHRDVLEAIREADFGLIAYPPSRHTENSIPTKLYEYLAAKLPILMVRHPRWEQLCGQYAAAIAFDWDNLNPAELLIEMQSPFYLIEPDQVTWDSEAPRLLQAIESLLSK